MASVTSSSIPRLLICDLDGTLLDTLDDLADSMNDALRSLGFQPHPRESYKQMVGDGAAMLALRAAPAAYQRDVATVEALCRTYLSVYERRWRFKTRPFEGIAKMLDAGVAGGMRIAVLSNKPEHFTRLTVESLLPHWPWADIRGQRPDTPRKPSPEGALALAANVGVDPRSCAFLGDSGADMRCARSAGMWAIGALWGFRTRDEIEAAGAHMMITSPGEVWPAISRNFDPARHHTMAQMTLR